MMRVAESEPNLISVVVVNGSRLRVIESKAMARVESAWLIKTGRVCCALALTAASRNAKKIIRRNIGAQCITDFFCRIREICGKNRRT
jgi:hypothetical protein